MSLVDKIKEIIATMADGHHHALVHLAGEVEGLKEGIAPADKAALGASIEAKVDAFLAELRGEFGARLSELEAAIAKLQPQPSQEPAPLIEPVAEEPEPSPATEPAPAAADPAAQQQPAGETLQPA